MRDSRWPCSSTLQGWRRWGGSVQLWRRASKRLAKIVFCDQQSILKCLTLSQSLKMTNNLNFGGMSDIETQAARGDRTPPPPPALQSKTILKLFSSQDVNKAACFAVYLFLAKYTVSSETCYFRRIFFSGWRMTNGTWSPVAAAEKRLKKSVVPLPSWIEFVLWQDHTIQNYLFFFFFCLSLGP